jgi:hypothetical protein
MKRCQGRVSASASTAEIQGHNERNNNELTLPTPALYTFLRMCVAAVGANKPLKQQEVESDTKLLAAMMGKADVGVLPPPVVKAVAALL